MSGDGAAKPQPMVGHRLQILAVGVLVLVIVEAVVGETLASVSGTYPTWLLVTHIVLALLLVGFGAHVLLRAWRTSRYAAQLSGVLVFAGVLAATISGAVFLWAGGSDAALLGMEVGAGVAAIGALLLLLFGWESLPAVTA